MTKQLYTGAKIPFDKPYVLLLDHDTADLADFSKILKSARSNITGSWGHSYPEQETLWSHIQDRSPGMYPTLEFRTRSYWVFRDEIDALQFRLSVKESIHVHMWPSRTKFTVYIVTDEHLD
jgi:hypothetical protein